MSCPPYWRVPVWLCRCLHCSCWFCLRVLWSHVTRAAVLFSVCVGMQHKSPSHHFSFRLLWKCFNSSFPCRCLGFLCAFQYLWNDFRVVSWVLGTPPSVPLVISTQGQQFRPNLRPYWDVRPFVQYISDRRISLFPHILPPILISSDYFLFGDPWDIKEYLMEFFLSKISHAKCFSHVGLCFYFILFIYLFLGERVLCSYLLTIRFGFLGSLLGIV